MLRLLISSASLEEEETKLKRLVKEKCFSVNKRFSSLVTNLQQNDMVHFCLEEK